jgi:hypothetical protein
VRARTFAAVAGAVLACAPIGCVGDDTVAMPSWSTPVQGGSGPPPSSYEDATAEDATLSEAGEDAPSPTFDASADSTVDGAAPAEAGATPDASDAAAEAASADAGDASDGA